MLEARVWTPESVERVLKSLQHGWRQNSGLGIRKPLLPSQLSLLSIWVLEKVPAFSGLQFSYLQNVKDEHVYLTDGFPSACIHWKEKLCLGWPDTIWAPHVGHRIIWGLAALMAAPGQGAAHSLCSSFRDTGTWIHIATGSRQKRIGQPSSPTHGILQWCLNRKEHALGIWYISVFAGVTSCESPFLQNVDYDPGVSVVMRFL